jgi:outer membrane protein TolC
MHTISRQFRRRQAHVCLTLLAATLGGCAVGPDFHRPAIDAPARYGETPPAARTVASKVAGGAAQRLAPGADVPGQWWTLFRSPALTELVTTALRDSPTIAAANAALRAAQEKTLPISACRARRRCSAPTTRS